MNNQKYILASSSPRRIEIMKAHGLNPRIIPAEINESLPDGIGMKDAVMFLALKKALSVENKINEKGYIIIAADTVVYKDEIIGKPKDRNDAFQMLAKIRNTNHYVATGVALIKTNANYKKVFCEVTEVFCKNYSDKEINEYLDTDEPYDKAGAYAIQGAFSRHIDHYEGDYNTVVGFPFDKIILELEKIK